ncbi:MAG: DMT family transporter [Actinomycetota bacterium]|nr:DMT family transporter [Actinomycetota bacterium]
MRWNLAVAGLAASWGFISVIVAGVDLPAEALVFERLALAALTLLAGLALARRLDLVRLPGFRVRVPLIGAVLGVHWFLFFETIKLSSVAVAVLMVYAAPIVIALVAPLVLPERRSLVALAATVPASGGVVLITLGGDEGTTVRPLALAAGVGAALTYAALVIATKRVTASLPAPTITFWSYLVAAVTVAPLLLDGGSFLPDDGEIGYVVLLGVVFTALSGFAYVWLLRKVTAQAVGVLSYIEPVSAAFLAWAILAEPLAWQVVVGGALIIAAGLVVILFEPQHTTAAEAPVTTG